MFIGSKEAYIDHLFSIFKETEPIYYNLISAIMHIDGMTQAQYQKQHRISSANYCILRSEALAALKAHLLRHGVSSILDTSM
ncbi:hypothetical protein [Paludibaculum fermentans]|uniref:hypothetical protein n=1 Tax=Paludibaculum fermentans TaxID=1473598 RepID=UPI003EC0E7AB